MLRIFKKSVLLILLILIQIYSTRGFTRNCEIEKIYDSCEKLQNSGPILRIEKDGTIVPNLYKILGASEAEKKDPLFVAEVNKIISPPKNKEANQKKLSTMMDYVRETYIELALDGRKENDPKLDAATLSIIKRLRTLKLARADEKEGSCDQMISNAFYLPSEHIIKICNGLAKGPDLMLLFIMAHEVGHSIDSCRLSTSLVEIDTDVKNKTCSEKLTASESPHVLNSHAGTVISLDEFSLHESTIIKCNFGKVVAPAQSNLGGNHISAIVNCVLEKAGANSSTPEMSFSSFLENIKTQLKNSNPEISEVQVNQMIENSLTKLTEVHEKYVERNREINRRMMGCGNAFLGNVNSSAEHSSDSLATRVLSKYIKNHSLDESQKASIIEFQGQLACGFKLSGGKKFNSPIYPNGQARADILLQDREVQKALNCDFSGEYICTDDQLKNLIKSDVQNTQLKTPKRNVQ